MIGAKGIRKGDTMIPRNELADILRNRLHEHLAQDRIDQLVGEILALETEWEEVNVPHLDMGYTRSDLCSSICWLADQTEQGAIIKFQRKKKRP
jgi:hypothetical protein